MTDRTIMQMEIHPELIRLRLERAERARIFGEMMRPASQAATMYGLGFWRVEHISPLDIFGKDPTRMP